MVMDVPYSPAWHCASGVSQSYGQAGSGGLPHGQFRHGFQSVSTQQQSADRPSIQA